MSKLIKFRFDLIRTRFKIRGAFNVVSLCLVLAALFFGIKAFQGYVGHYEQMSVLIGLSIYVFFCQYIFVTDFDLKCKQMKTYFGVFDETDIKRYYLYKNLVIYLGVTVYLLLPAKIEDLPLFLLYMFVLNLLLVILIAAKNRLADSSYHRFNLIIRVLVCGSLILYLRSYQLFSLKVELNAHSLIIGFVLNVFIVAEEFKMIKMPKQNGNVVSGITWSKKLPFFCKSNDVLFLIRRNLLLEPILLVIFGNIAIDKLSEDVFTKLFTLVLSYVCAYVAVYRALVKNEENKVIFCLQRDPVGKIKKRKMWSTVCLSALFFVITFPFILFWVSPLWIACGYVISLLVFVISGYVVKIQGEKVFNYKVLMTDKDIAILVVVQAILAFIISYVVGKVFSGVFITIYN